MNNKKVLFVMLGQSNATGHALPMTEQDKIKTPLKNVFGLQRECNQSFDITKLTWSGYTSAGTNLGEDGDDNYSVSNCLAKMWQTEIDNGKDFPDLYIITISVGAEGVTEKYMWYPYREKKLKPGKLFECDISLYPLTKHIFSLVEKDFDFVRIHWRGGEEETAVDVEKLKNDLVAVYDTLFYGLQSAIDIPLHWYLHKIVSLNKCDEIDSTGGQRRSAEYINSVFDHYANTHNNMSVFDAARCPHYAADTRTYNLFINDAVHYNKETNMWTAQKILESYKSEEIV